MLSGPCLSLKVLPSKLSPMATMLRDHRRISLTTASTTSILDSVGARLEEAREISRYIIGLLIFLGLLGTFWGLLDTVASVSDVIKTLSLSSGDVTKLFADLQAGLRAPLSGMGTAFGSSLFGLSGSLVLGFLDLLAGQSQNRFYNELEEWLASITQLSIGGEGDGGSANFLRGLVEETNDRLESVARALEAIQAGRSQLDATLNAVADRLGALADRFGAQEPLARQVSERLLALEPALKRLSAPPAAVPVPPDTARGLDHLRGIEQTLGRLVQVVETPPPPPPVPAAPPQTDERALTHLKSLDEAIRRLVGLTETGRPGLDDAARRHLASIDAALQRLAALGAVAASAGAGAGSGTADGAALAQFASMQQTLDRLAQALETQVPAVPAPPALERAALEHLGSLDAAVRQHLASIDAALQRLPSLDALAAGNGSQAVDGAALAHLASIEQHLQHIAREAGQMQHRVAQEVRGELRSFAQSIAALAEEPPANPEP